MASLGACTNITAQMYAERHQWPLKAVQSVASFARVPTENPPGSDATIGMVDRIELEISFAGDLSQEQEQRLLEIVGRCPIHRMLTGQVQIQSRLVAFRPAPARTSDRESLRQEPVGTSSPSDLAELVK